ncbi:MAG: DUF1887 family CARF protein [Clostridiales bacterium]|nr:DUF1887 family CARF protein [Clostridiales bacterium]
MTLIEYFDKDTIKNILAVLTLKPQRVVYIYDSAINDDKYFIALKKCFKKHIKDVEVEKVPVNINSVQDIYEKTIDAIERYDACAMEMTGGSELMMIAGHRAGFEKNIKMYHTDIAGGKIHDIDDPEFSMDTAVLSLEDFMDAKGAEFVGESHREPEEEHFGAILDMCRYIFKNLKDWSYTCGYLQAAGSAMGHGTHFSARVPFVHKDGRKYRPNAKMLQMFEKNKFIEDLSVSDERVSFTYCYPEAETYLTTYGLWLEMYVFINAKQLNKFSDVKLGAMIDWDAYDGVSVAGNEIDVIIMENSIPIFVSCKLRGISTPDVNELYIQRKRLGGWFSKGIIVTSGDEKVKQTGTLKKAEEFGIIVMDRKDIRSQNFGERLYEAVSQQDIVAMKWSRV